MPDSTVEVRQRLATGRSARIKSPRELGAPSRSRQSKSDMPPLRKVGEHTPSRKTPVAADMDDTAETSSATAVYSPSGRVRRPAKGKVSKACDQCRGHKVKCSGTQPCSRCHRTKKACRFSVEEKRVAVPESYLRELEGRQSLATPQSRDELARSVYQSRQTSDGRSPLPPSPSLHTVQHTPRTDRSDAQRVSQHGLVPHSLTSVSDGIDARFQQNPLVDNDYTFAAAGGRYWYMGPTSSWSFCRRVLALLGKFINPADAVPWHRPDQGAFHLRWSPLGTHEQPDVSNLPPLDYALLLVNTAKFYLGDLFALIEEPIFTQRVHEFYEDPPGKARLARTWYAQFLLVLAFGKACPMSSSAQAPPGSQFALRAMSMMPDISGLYPDPVLSVSTMALAALYFQSVDMRISAYYHISQALRTCVIEAMHRHMPEQVVGAEHSKRCNRVFWAVYILEREFSSSMGAPSALSDADITVKPPSHANTSTDGISMALKVRLSRLTARILSTVYGVDRQFDDSLLSTTQSILRDLAHLSHDLTELLRTHFEGSVSKASRMAQRLVITYHHCVVLSTRPIVMCALQMHIESADMQLTQPITLTPTVSSLLLSCIDSAQTILKMLRVLGEEDLLDVFLPFQLDAAHSSAFILYLIRLISPSLFQDDSWPNDVQYVLDKMISNGSLVAPLRKLELEHLEHVMGDLNTGVGQSWGLTPGPDYMLDHEFEPALPEDMLGDPFMDIFGTNGVSGLPPQELLDLADQLNVE